MKTPEQVLTELVSDEFEFDLGMGLVKLCVGELRAAYSILMSAQSVPQPEYAVGSITNWKGGEDFPYDVHVAGLAHRHATGGLLGEMTFKDFMKYHSFREIIAAGQERQRERHREVMENYSQMRFHLGDHLPSEPGSLP